MQRLQTIALKDGTSIRVDMRQQTWCLLPDLLPPVPAARQSTEDEVIRQLQPPWSHLRLSAAATQHAAAQLAI
jgi:hypothetical protein